MRVFRIPPMGCFIVGDYNYDGYNQSCLVECPVRVYGIWTLMAALINDKSQIEVLYVEIRLNFNKIGDMALLLRGVCRNHRLLARMQPMMTSRVTMAMTAKQEQDKFWEKNKTMNRPMSPHLTIYSPQVTSMLSITHRGTGIGLTVGIYALGLSMSVLPHDFAHYLELVKSLSYGPSLLFLTKMAIVWPLTFHTFNGVRHLAWDTGYGYNLKTLYKTGYLVLGLSFVVTAAIAML